MEDKKRNEELQSRRDFFKKAAKAALPVIGAIALSAMPNIVKADVVELGCGKYTCSQECKNACTSCRYTCQDGCKNACTSCKYTCDGSCKGTCSGSSR